MRVLLLVIICMQSSIITGQVKGYNSNDYKCIGYVQGEPIYTNNDYSSAYYNKLFKLKDVFSNDFSFMNYDSQILGNPIFISDSVIISYAGSDLKIVNKGIEKTLHNLDIDYNMCLSKNQFYLFCSKYINNRIELIFYQLNSDLISETHVPIYGVNPQIIGEYLYFSSYHICNWYSDHPEDIYRVKVGDWNSPELVLTNVVSGSWFVIPESNVIYARIKLQEKGKGILWNIDAQSYAIIDAIHGSKVINYKGKYYYEIRTSNKPISYKPVELPKVYSHKDIRILCDDKDRIIINLPNKEKPFTNTFITEELLYNSTSQNLLELTKEELRILRNAFFARQGYTFKSKDLQDFFGQFEWYHKMADRNKYLEIPNEEVVISPLDKERVELILEIENSK
ncbi:MAG: YARHG domain-containing protein [Bacteroidales bacterium]|nr:YARHG domain-containing protein [Bacteroidales bacterium]